MKDNIKKLEKIYKLYNLLLICRRPVSLSRIMEELNCSERTVYRTIACLRDECNAPIDQQENGYILQEKDLNRFHLPGFWMSPAELYALAACHHLLAHLQPSILQNQIEPLREYIEKIFAKHNIKSPEIGRRIKIFQIGARPTHIEYFRLATTALFERRDLRIRYHGRDRNEITERSISPQRLIYYRSNWYLDAWCHNKRGLRTFSLDRFQPIEMLNQVAKVMDDEELDEYFKSSYGIFSGQVNGTAILRFTSSAARWVANEEWHPEQIGKILNDGSYELRIPYSDDRELTGDILRYGPEVQVLGPLTLRQKVATLATQTAALYQQQKTD